MKIFAIIELPDDTQLSSFVPDFDALQTRIRSGIAEAVMTSTRSRDIPTVRTHVNNDGVYCSRCAAPLLPSGACSSRNCPVGRQPFKRMSASGLVRAVPGVRLGSTIKKK